uniref:Bm13452, isoform a n=1 Tax=Brugia malayi TaxID=6279 RepID=A0A1I9G271_BRUMA|nr:Bm13452, isoform a [Brugia malayi]
MHSIFSDIGYCLLPVSQTCSPGERNSVANGDKRQQKSGNLDRLDALYHHWKSLSLNFEKQAENFEKRLKEERDRTDAEMRNAVVTIVESLIALLAI